MNQGISANHDTNSYNNPFVFTNALQQQTMQHTAVSWWTLSGAKRTFDCCCVVLAVPVLAPLLFVVALVVKCTSAGPILFVQKRVGYSGRIFPILKFRTMKHVVENTRHSVTTVNDQTFTSVGPFLRRYKLDELPQLWNVLVGHMSLVGPRPKLPEHCKEHACLNCRPGITGAATIAFAREETLLAQIPDEKLSDFYRDVVLPVKHLLDAEYMAGATFASDFRLLVNTVLRRWNDSIWEDLPAYSVKSPARIPFHVVKYATKQLREYVG